MEASQRKLRVHNPLSDCTNTVSVSVTDTTTTAAAAASTQSSTASSAAIKRYNPTLSAVTKSLLTSLTKKNDAVASPRDSALSTPQVSSSVSGTGGFEVSEPSSVHSLRQSVRKSKSTGKENVFPSNCPRAPRTRSVGKKAKRDGPSMQSKMDGTTFASAPTPRIPFLSEMDTTPIASAPTPRIPFLSEMDTTPIASTPTPRISLSTSDTSNREVYEIHSVYSRRKTVQKKNSRGQENIGPYSCHPVLKIRNSRDNSNEDGQNSLSKKSKTPCKKKSVPVKKETSKYTSPELEKQRAYFADLDKEELEEAEEWESD